MCNLCWSKNINELVSTHGYSQNQIVVWRYASMSKVSTQTAGPSTGRKAQHGGGRFSGPRQGILAGTGGNQGLKGGRDRSPSSSLRPAAPPPFPLSLPSAAAAEPSILLRYLVACLSLLTGCDAHGPHAARAVLGNVTRRSDNRHGRRRRDAALLERLPWAEDQGRRLRLLVDARLPGADGHSMRACLRMRTLPPLTACEAG